MHRFAIDYWGVQVAVEWDNAELSPAIEGLLLPVWVNDPDLRPESVFRVTTDAAGKSQIQSPADCTDIADRRDVVESLERRLHLYLASKTRQAAFVHAGAVRWKDRAILIPGSSHSGKSTLVLQFVQAGAQYLSDEYAIIDQQGRVHSFPRPARDRQPGGTRRLAAYELGWNGQTESLEVAAVIVTSFQDQAVWSPQRVSPGQSALELFKHTVSAQLSPQVVIDCLSLGVANAITLKGVRGEASQLVDELLHSADLVVG